MGTIEEKLAYTTSSINDIYSATSEKNPDFDILSELADVADAIRAISGGGGGGLDGFANIFTGHIRSGTGTEYSPCAFNNDDNRNLDSRFLYMNPLNYSSLRIEKDCKLRIYVSAVRVGNNTNYLRYRITRGFNVLVGPELITTANTYNSTYLDIELYKGDTIQIQGHSSVTNGAGSGTLVIDIFTEVNVDPPSYAPVKWMPRLLGSTTTAAGGTTMVLSEEYTKFDTLIFTYKNTLDDISTAFTVPVATSNDACVLGLVNNDALRTNNAIQLGGTHANGTALVTLNISVTASPLNTKQIMVVANTSVSRGKLIYCFGLGFKKESDEESVLVRGQISSASDRKYMYPTLLKNPRDYDLLIFDLEYNGNHYYASDNPAYTAETGPFYLACDLGGASLQVKMSATAVTSVSYGGSYKDYFLTITGKKLP